MEYENMRVPELNVPTRDRKLRSYSLMRKDELVALLQRKIIYHCKVGALGPQLPMPGLLLHLHRGSQRM